MPCATAALLLRQCFGVLVCYVQNAFGRPPLFPDAGRDAARKAKLVVFPTKTLVEEQLRDLFVGTEGENGEGATGCENKQASTHEEPY